LYFRYFALYSPKSEVVGFRNLFFYENSRCSRPREASSCDYCSSSPLPSKASQRLLQSSTSPSYLRLLTHMSLPSSLLSLLPRPDSRTNPFSGEYGNTRLHANPSLQHVEAPVAPQYTRTPFVAATSALSPRLHHLLLPRDVHISRQQEKIVSPESPPLPLQVGDWEREIPHSNPKAALPPFPESSWQLTARKPVR